MSPEEFRSLGHRAIDLIAENLERLQNRQEPARRPVPEELREELLHAPLPQRGSDPAELIEYVAEKVLPYPLGHINPRFFAWVNSPAAPIGVLGELLAAGMNSSIAGGDQSGFYIEHVVLDWLKEIMGFPRSSGGILVSGGSMASTVGLAVMRFVKSHDGDVRTQGFNGESSPMVVYTSSEGHSCIQKAVELLGIGNGYLRRVAVDAEFRMDTAELREQIAADRAAGLRPVCVAASAGTVSSGAIDPMDEIADICAAEGLWFHVDGAFGGVGILCDEVRPLYRGIERADSLGIDPHKWMYVPVECGCVLVRDRQAMRNTFSAIPPYLRDDRQMPWFSEFGPQQSRSFRALKLWLSLQQIGLEGYRHLITRDIRLSESLRKRIRACPDLELLSDGPLCVTCFRYHPQGVDQAGLDDLNGALITILQRRGVVYLTSTALAGQFVLRANIMNFRTAESDLDVLIDEVLHAGQEARKWVAP